LQRQRYNQNKQILNEGKERLADLRYIKELMGESNEIQLRRNDLFERYMNAISKTK